MGHNSIVRNDLFVESEDISMKKIVVFAMLVVCLSAMVTGCGNKNNSATDPSASPETTNEATQTPTNENDNTATPNATDDNKNDDNDLSDDVKDGVDDAADGVNDVIDGVDDAVDDVTGNDKN